MQIVSGTLPVEWSQLTNMWALGLDPVTGTLGITGTLPSEWGTWSNMALVNIASAPHLEGVCVCGGTIQYKPCSRLPNSLLR